MYLYGMLTYDKIPLDFMLIGLTMKEIHSFYLPNWMQSVPKEDVGAQLKRVGADLSTGGKIFGTKVQNTIKLEDWESALEESKKLANDGKFLVKCLKE